MVTGIEPTMSGLLNHVTTRTSRPLYKEKALTMPLKKILYFLLQASDNGEEKLTSWKTYRFCVEDVNDQPSISYPSSITLIQVCRHD